MIWGENPYFLETPMCFEHFLIASYCDIDIIDSQELS